MVAQPNPSVSAAADLLKGVTFYASFDTAVKGDFGGGELALSTRFNHKTEKGAFVFEKGFPEKAFRIAPGKGISGGALEADDVKDTLIVLTTGRSLPIPYQNIIEVSNSVDCVQ